MRRIACDLCVIGAGPGGLTAASAAAQLGRQVVLVERDAMGGDCLNRGCVPSKALLAAARHAHLIRSAADFGIAPSEPVIDFSRVMAHVHAVMASIEPDDSQERFEALGCTVIRKAARFLDHSTLEAGEFHVKARRFVIATGSSPWLPSLPGLESVPYFTSDNIFDSVALPKRLIVLGAGPMGLELAQAFRRLGSEVIVLEALAPLAGHDPELVRILLDALRREAVEIVSACKVASVREGPLGIAVSVEMAGAAREVEGSHLLLAAGRRANVDDLNLEAAGVEFSARGIRVDARLRTTNPRVYAVGDVAGGLQFTHIAAHQAGLVIRNALFRQPVRYDRAKMPSAIFTDPELAQVGLTEAEAAERGLSRKILRWPLSRSDRARIERRPQGLLKVVIGRGGRVIGAGLVGLHAGELILPWARMVAAGERIGSMARTVVPYPTLSEESRRVALTNYRGLASNPWVRRVIDMVSSLG
jgi:pyruvate/2-oxoglutarate dehydrogenase complex dihydrolipoamide dehydrogenase (E3) component